MKETPKKFRLHDPRHLAISILEYSSILNKSPYPDFQIAVCGAASPNRTKKWATSFSSLLFIVAAHRRTRSPELPDFSRGTKRFESNKAMYRRVVPRQKEGGYWC